MLEKYYFDDGSKKKIISQWWDKEYIMIAKLKELFNKFTDKFIRKLTTNYCEFPNGVKTWTTTDKNGRIIHKSLSKLNSL